MAKKEQTPAPAPALPPRTHLIVRSRGAARFRRGGIEFFASKWSALALAELDPAIRAAVVAEPMLESHEVTAEDPRLLDALGEQNDGLDELSAPQLRGILRDALVEIERRGAMIQELRLAAKGDSPPAEGPVPGSLGALLVE